MGEPHQPGRSGAPTSLLDRVVALALDEDYAEAAARRHNEPAAPRRPLLWVAVALLGVLLATAAVQTQRSAPALAQERAGLVAEIRSRSEHFQTLRQRNITLTTSVQTRQRGLLEVAERSLLATAQMISLEAATGAAQVSGPGVEVVVDDAPAADPEGTRRHVLDVDLQLLANGLWEAGAEAIAVNGHRLTSLSAIRGAGRAITVGNSSLTPPYVVAAIGNPDALPARFLDTTGGQSWLNLRANLGLQFAMTTEDTLTLAADQGLRTCCRHAEVGDR